MATIDKAIDALFLLNEKPGATRLSELAAELELPRSSLHRVLRPLVQRGLAEQDEQGRYRVGPALLALGHNAIHHEPLALAARPVLETAAADLGETFFLVLAKAGRLMVVEKAEGSGFLRAAPRLGSTVPAHATAVGKLFLANRPDLIEAGRLRRFTRGTRTTAKALTAEIDRVRQQGWAINDEEWQAGLSVAAAPVELDGRMAGAVALATVSARMHEIGVRKAVRLVRHAAEGITLRLERRTP